MKRTVLTSALVLGVASAPAIYQRALASGGDFSLDFTAAAPFTYDHATGGGAYNDRTVGKDKDIVESLEGGDFACGDVVTFLTQVSVDGGASGAQTIRLDLTYTAHATGQQGIALVDNDVVGAGTSAAINSGADDSGTVDDNGSTATVVSEGIDGNGLTFFKPNLFTRSVEVTDLEAGEKVVVRTDVAIACNGQSPTGNMQARLVSASVTAPQEQAGTINVGDQTIPFKRVGDVKCDPKDPACKP